LLRRWGRICARPRRVIAAAALGQGAAPRRWHLAGAHTRVEMAVQACSRGQGRVPGEWRAAGASSRVSGACAQTGARPCGGGARPGSDPAMVAIGHGASARGDGCAGALARPRGTSPQRRRSAGARPHGGGVRQGRPRAAVARLRWWRRGDEDQGCELDDADDAQLVSCCSSASRWTPWSTRIPPPATTTTVMVAQDCR
jgi:hypothetical protein